MALSAVVGRVRHPRLSFMVDATRGGGDERGNLQCLCRVCNRRKSNKMPA